MSNQLSKKSICCRELTSVEKAVSPFSKIIALGWYDSPTAGILQCEKLLGVMLRSIWKAKWPFWGYPWTSQSAEEELKIYEKIKGLIYSAITPKLVIAAVDITKEIIVSKQVDWFSFLELSLKEYEDD